MKDSFITLFVRDLQRLHEEIVQFEETQLWKSHPGISNCPGNLVLHLCGNLNHFIGAQLGQTGYVRNRENEFSEKNVPKSTLFQQVEEVQVIVEQTLSALSDAQLAEPFPLAFGGKIPSTGEMLLQLLGHLNYHLGQINYFRRMI